MLSCALCAGFSQLRILLSSLAVLYSTITTNITVLSHHHQAKSLLKDILQSPFIGWKSTRPVYTSNVKIMSDRENDIWQEIWTVSLVQHSDLACQPHQLRSPVVSQLTREMIAIILVSSLVRGRGSSHINGLWQQGTEHHPENKLSPSPSTCNFKFSNWNLFRSGFFYEGLLFPGAQGGDIKSVSCWYV